RGAKLAQSSAHVGSCTRSEGQGKNPGWIVDSGMHAMGDAVGNSSGLASTCSGQNTQRTTEGFSCLPLFSVQAREQIYCWRIVVFGHLFRASGRGSPYQVRINAWAIDTPRGISI